jgi:hypothetical protein
MVMLAVEIKVMSGEENWREQQGWPANPVYGFKCAIILTDLEDDFLKSVLRRGVSLIGKVTGSCWS